MKSTSQETIEQIRDAGAGLFVMATGAGAGLQDMLWRVPGIGAVLVGAQFPYAQLETNQFLGFKPEGYVNRDTAILQASAAYMRAKAVTGQKPAVGLALTAVAASSRIPKGGHRVHAAVMTDTGCWSTQRTLQGKNRMIDGVDCDYLGLDLLHRGLFPDSLDLSHVDSQARAEELFWQRPVFVASGGRFPRLDPYLDFIEFPGSFNPSHAGHFHMAHKVQNHARKQVVLSVNQDHPAKGNLTVQQMLARVAFLRAERIDQPFTMVFTRGQGLYLDKARSYGFKPSYFVVGSDTMERMLDPKWGVEPAALMEGFLQQATRFYVFNRNGKRLVDLLDLLPNREKYQHLFVGMGDSLSISSTDIRAAQG